jgi:hypothetical protein
MIVGSTEGPRTEKLVRAGESSWFRARGDTNLRESTLSYTLSVLRGIGALAGVLAVGTGFAATRFVATTGTDTGNTCANAASPCASIARCVSQMAAGDTCTVADGVYTDPVQAVASLTCTTAAPCTIKSTNRLGAVLVFTPAGPCCSTSVAAISVTGRNWVVDGFKVQANYQRMFVRGTGSTGLTFKNNRVEISPFYGDTALMTTGTSDLTIQNNWVHHFPGCVNDATACSSGGYTACDFVEDPAGASFLNSEFHVDQGTNVIFEGNDFGHMRNPTTLRNLTNLTIRKNRCVNATNHGCFFVNDARNVIVENNIGDVDSATSCTDGSEVLQSSLWDTYCAADVTIRNNTVVGRGVGWVQELIDQEPNAGASSSCGDSAAPNVCANGGCYQHMLVYNNIVYDGKRANGAYGLDLSGTAYTGTAPQFRADNNLYYATSGPCIANWQGTARCSMAAWQATDVDGDGVRDDVHGRYIAPQFVNYAGHDFKAASSAAPQVNTGVNSTLLPCPLDDFDGNARNDGLCDIGAHELGGGTPPTPPGTVQNLSRTDAH